MGDELHNDTTKDYASSSCENFCCCPKLLAHEALEAGSATQRAAQVKAPPLRKAAAAGHALERPVVELELEPLELLPCLIVRLQRLDRVEVLLGKLAELHGAPSVGQTCSSLVCTPTEGVPSRFLANAARAPNSHHIKHAMRQSLRPLVSSVVSYERSSGKPTA